MNALDRLKEKAAPASKKSGGIIVTEPVLVTAAMEFIAADEAKDRADAALESIQMAFKPSARRHWFVANHGRATPESTLNIPTPVGTVGISFAAQWYPKGDPIAMGVPAEEVRTKSVATINLDLVPEHLFDVVVNELMDVLEKHQCGDAMKSKVSLYPRETFAITRHSLSPDVNEAMELAGLGTRVAFRRK